MGSSSVGGMIGWNGEIVVASYSTGSVTGRREFVGIIVGKESVGGLVGRNTGDLIASYAMGNVSGGTHVGGVVGSNEEGAVRATFSVGHIAGESIVGGLAGKNTPRWENYSVTLEFSSWDNQTSGQLNAVGEGEPTIGSGGTTTTELQTASAYAGLFENWRVDVDNANGDDNYSIGVDDVWDFGRNDQYPALKVDLHSVGVPTWQEFGPQGRVPQQPEDNGKYKVDADGLIEISNIE